MVTRFSKLTLRDLFWLMLLAAVGIGWWVEHQRAGKQLAGYGVRAGGSLPNQKSPEWFKRNTILIELRNLDNLQLHERFRKTRLSTFSAYNEYFACLMEMARRGMHVELQEEYDKLMVASKEKHLSNLADMLPTNEVQNAWLLTALRRAQGKPDPLRIEVEVETVRDTTAKDPKSIPEVRVTVKNVDTEVINLTRGGDYRSGRQTRFRVQLTNEKGFRIPDANFSLFGPGGGISSFGPVKPNELLFEKTPLDARKYVSAPASGRYQLQVIYSEQEIASEPDVDGLIVWQSQPITVQVENQMRAKEERISLIPLISILACAAIVHWIVEQWRQLQTTADQTSPRRWFNWRDLAALAILIVLIYGWSADLSELKAALDLRRPYDAADWSMKVVDVSRGPR